MGDGGITVITGGDITVTGDTVTDGGTVTGDITGNSTAADATVEAGRRSRLRDQNRAVDAAAAGITVVTVKFADITVTATVKTTGTTGITVTAIATVTGAATATVKITVTVARHAYATTTAAAVAVAVEVGAHAFNQRRRLKKFGGATGQTEYRDSARRRSVVRLLVAVLALVADVAAVAVVAVVVPVAWLMMMLAPVAAVVRNPNRTRRHDGGDGVLVNHLVDAVAKQHDELVEGFNLTLQFDAVDQED